MTTPDWPGREEIARRARRRWWITMGVVAVVSGSTGPLLSASGILGSRHRRNAAPHHHVVAIMTLIVGPVLLVGCVVAAVFLVRAMRRSHGMFSAPIEAGLRRTQRRAIGRAIRRGTPIMDPTLASVARETAERAIRYQRWMPLFFTVVVVLELFEATTQRGLQTRVFFAAAAAMFVAFGAYSVWFARRARRYLDQAGR